MEAHVTIKATPQELDIIREALGVHVEVSGEQYETLRTTDPATAKKARERQAQAKFLLDKLS